MKKVALSLMLVGLLGSFASAELLEYSWSEATHPATQTDVILNDCVVNTDGAEWLSSIFYCELSAGSLFQDPTYMATPALQWMHIPNVNDIDSWVEAGVSLFADGNELAPMFSGDPANAAASITFIADLVSGSVPAWNGTGAQFAFTPDAQGEWAFKVSAKGSDAVIYQGFVVDGVMMIPEPGTIALLLCGLVGLCVLRRK
jgi:hypothetical protein